MIFQCRERWFNHLDPALKKGGWTEEEDAILVEAQMKWGNSWTKIAKLLPGRFVVVDVVVYACIPDLYCYPRQLTNMIILLDCQV